MSYTTIPYHPNKKATATESERVILIISESRREGVGYDLDNFRLSKNWKTTIHCDRSNLQYADDRGKYRFGFNGYEMDNETKGFGLHYTTELRQYDSRLGRWFSTDPFNQFVGSQYYAFANNPIFHIDPDGGWVPTVTETKDSEGNVNGGFLSAQAEKGDDATSLAKFLSIEQNEADKLFSQMNMKGNGLPENTIKVPEKIALPINNAIKDIYNPSGKDYKQQWYEYFISGDNYNCATSALMISRGETPNFSNVFGTFGGALYRRVEGLYNNYDKVGSDKYVFGRTLIMFGEETASNTNVTHAATYLGASKNGTVYTWTKNGTIEAPKIMTVPALLKMDDYRKSKPLGYFNYRNPGSKK